MSDKITGSVVHNVREGRAFFYAKKVMIAVEALDAKSTAQRDMPLKDGVTQKQLLDKLELGNPLCVYSMSDEAESILYAETKGVVTVAISEDTQIRITTYRKGFDASKHADKLLEKIKDLKHVEEPRADGVYVAFSYLGPTGPSIITEFLNCPKWSEIMNNYPPNLRLSFAKLIRMKNPSEVGRLLLLHGDPGTGKTYSLRALMMAWNDIYNFCVVTDPERFASEPSYYFALASQASNQIAHQNVESMLEKKRKPMIFIMEDAADMIVSESRQRHFDKVGKLLNMTDGLFGQGRRDLLLITFNERVEQIDSAFTRPGRCIANLRFKSFTSKEAAAWLEKKSPEKNWYESDLPEKMTLAEMYAKHLGREVTATPTDKEDPIAAVAGSLR